MNGLHLVSYFFGGAVLANAVPHLVSGLRGEAFQSPFAKPPGKGLSSSRTNVLWGFLNLAIGYLLVEQVGEFDLKTYPDAAALGLGVLATVLLLAHSFGPLHGGDRKDRS